MESLALRPHLLARQAHATTCFRSSSGLRPTRMAVIFSGRRIRIGACVAAAEVEEAQQMATEQPSTPAEGRQPRGENGNGGARRRDGSQGGQGRPRKLPTKYKIEELVIGQEVEGIVGSAQSFGAFVDIGLGGKDALIHISQLSDGFVSDVASIVQPGQQVTARIYNVDIAANKVGLTMRSPESEQQREQQRGERSAGRFAGRSGESQGRSGEGQERSDAPVQARARRAPREKKDIKYPSVGEELIGKVASTANYGVFVTINDDLRALLHQDEIATPDGREVNVKGMFNAGDDIKVRVLKVDAKNRRVDLTQRSEEERAAEKTLTEQGARTVKVSGLNSLGAALARAGIRKQDFEDLSKAPEEDTAEPAAEVPAAAAPSMPEPETVPVENNAAAESSPAAALEQEDNSDTTPNPVPEVPAADEMPANTQSSATPLDEVAPATEVSPVSEGISAPTGGEAVPVLQEPEPEALPSAAVAAEPTDAGTPVPEPEPETPTAAPEPVEAPVSEAAAAPEEVEVEPSTEAFPAAEAATDASSATLGSEAAPEPAVEQPASSPAPVEAAAAPSTDSAPAPFKVDAKSAKALRDQTGAGMMDAKKALIETQSDVAKAVEWLRKKGLSGADKKSGRIASEGVVAAYIHAGSRLGVLVELNCETDFVARGDKFKELVSDMAMQIAASGDVTVVSVDDVPADVKQKEFDVEMGKEDIQSKPEQIRPKIVEGRVAKTLKTMALLEQAFIKDTDKDVGTVIKESVAALGENIQIRRFAKFVLGEGIEKKTNDLAKEVEAQTKAFEEAAAAKKAASAPDSAAPAPEAEAQPAQVKVDAKAVKQLRQASGAGMMDAKKALLQTGGDVDKAMEYLRKKGLASADKKSGRLASEGAIGAYIHAGSRLGVLVEVNCETDFVARGDTFKELVQDIAMQIAASPGVDIVSIEEAPQEELERERALEMQKEDIQSKPENIRPKIVDGRVQKIFKERALLEQAFIKDTSKTVGDHIKAQVATIGENIQVRRFSRFVLGEGIEKKQENFAAEIAAATGQA